MSYHDEFARNIGIELKDYIFAAELGKFPGVSTGFYELDRYIGRMEGGQLWLIGGYPGVGKSYFVLNMVDNLLKVSDEFKVLVFSTEISPKAYALRHIFMRAGLYRRTYEDDPHAFGTKINSVLNEYMADQDLNRRLAVVGNVSTYEEIEAKIRAEKPSVAFIDYVQQLSVGETYSTADAMPLIAIKLQNLAKELNVPIVVISQISNYSAKDNVANSPVAPFDYGKELHRAAHVSIVLKRDKKDGKLSPVLQAHIIKSRDGDLGVLFCQVLPGYKLMRVDTQEAQKLNLEFSER